MLQRIDEVDVTARDMNSNLVLDSCTLQFRYKGIRFMFVYPIYVEWNFPLLSIGTIHFRFNGCWVVFFIFVQILIEHSASKQWRF